MSTEERPSVRLIMDARIKPGKAAELRTAYASLRDRVCEEPGLISHQLCEAIDDPERWMVISEFSGMEAAQAWSRSEDHARLVGPMGACFIEVRSTIALVRDGVGRG